MMGLEPLGMHETGISARWLGYSRAVGIMIGMGDGIATKITFEKVEPGTIIERPSLSITPERAQSLMDDLWACGFRPTRGAQSEGVTAAQGRHLEDMRAVAFAKLGVVKP